MVVNQKAVKVINKIFEAGITEEKDISNKARICSSNTPIGCLVKSDFLFR